MTKRTIYFLKLWLVALMGLVSIDSLAQSDYELVIEMRDGTKRFTQVTDDYPLLGYMSLMDGFWLRVYTGETDYFEVKCDDISQLYTQEATSITLKGDVNGDHVVNISDIVDTINYIHGNPPADFNITAADLNADGDVNEKDITMIIDIILNK